ncbi:MAG: OsmC family protein [Oscillospiraceae bacterium]|nr:OsmC family protein [Oscillospiraceae bacterium]MBQ8917215.1 OsmC family protein [Oscillospiraceae bacterium]MBQ9108679.1 OsmC family protein [Oscillospiraceae bacterium]
MANLTYKVSSVSENDTLTRVNARGLEFVIDEPVNAGGTNLGPNPVEYLLGALAGCMSITARLVAKQMGIAVNHLSIDLEGDLDTAKFMGRSAQGRSGYSEIRLTVNADLEATPQQKLEWMKAVKARCPVSDNIGNATPVQIFLK